MGKVFIYIKLVDGVLVYRDSEEDHGHSIQTSVDPGDTIIWKLDKCSGISEITGLTILTEPAHFFHEEPKRKDFNEWKAEVSKKATGEVTYQAEYIECETGKTMTGAFVGEGEPPSILIKA